MDLYIKESFTDIQSLILVDSELPIFIKTRGGSETLKERNA